MDILFIFTSILFFTWVFRNILYWVWFLQQSNFRLDLFLAHLRYQKTRFFSSPLTLIKIFILFAYLPTIFDDKFIIPFHILVVIAFCIDLAVYVNEIFSHSFRVPRIKWRTLLHIFPVWLIIGVLYFNPLIDSYLWILLLDRFLIIIVCIFWLAFSFPVEIYDDLQLEQARKQKERLRKAIIIGITGDRKGNVAMFIWQILFRKFNVVYIRDTLSSLYQLTEIVNTEVNQNVDILIVKLHVYKKKEMTILGELLCPNIIVATQTTTITRSFFHSIKEKIMANLELLAFLSDNGVFIGHAENLISMRVFKSVQNFLKKKHAEFSVYGNSNQGIGANNMFGSHNVEAKNIIEQKSNIRFDLSLQNKSYQFRVKTVVKNQMEDILPAIMVANHVGLRISELKQAISEIV